MTMMKHKFIEGAKNNSIEDNIAGEVFELMAHFAGYGFNKSHSAGYAILAYQTAWLKTHYPAEFMASALSSEMDNTDRIVILIEECRRMGINVLQPDVNSSYDKFTVEEENILFGLGGIKNVGHGSIDAIVAARKKGEPFRDFYDFCARVDLKSLNKRMIESLILAGAMDSFDAGRSRLLAGIELAVEYAQNKQREREMGQFNLFGDSDTGKDIGGMKPMPDVKPWGRMEKLAKEKSVLGFWFSGHPLEGYAEDLKAFTTPFNRLVTKPDRAAVTVGGVITSITRRTTKKDDKPYINMRVEDMESSGDVILMNGAYDEYKDKLEVDSMVIIEGTVSNKDNDQPSVFANSLNPLESARGKHAHAVNITLSTIDMKEFDLEPIAQMCEKYPGKLRLWINLKTASSGNFRIKSKRYRVSSDPALVNDLKSILGQKEVWIS